MAFKYPDKPWQDGQTITVDIAHKKVVVAVYEEDKNLWVWRKLNDDGLFSNIPACTVLLDDSCECDQIQNIEWDDIKDVYNALCWLHYYLTNDLNGALGKIKTLEGEITAIKARLDELEE